MSVLSSYMRGVGVTDRQLADTLRVPAELVRGWRTGEVPLPAYRAQEIEDIAGLPRGSLSPSGNASRATRQPLAQATRQPTAA